MPKGYVVFTEAIKDEAGMQAYGQKAGPTIAQSGARVIAVDDHPEVLEGDWHGTRTVILEFDSVDAARKWYQSSDYQAAIPLRQAAADSNGAIISGLDLPAG